MKKLRPVIRRCPECDGKLKRVNAFTHDCTECKRGWYVVQGPVTK